MVVGNMVLNYFSVCGDMTGHMIFDTYCFSLVHLCILFNYFLIKLIYDVFWFNLDPANAAVIIQSGGIPLVIQCLSSPVRNTVRILTL
jgi:hypothetical protein